MTVCCLLLVDRCVLRIAWHVLVGGRYLNCVVWWSLSVVRCVRCLVFAVCCVLFGGCRVLRSVYGLISVVWCVGVVCCVRVACCVA